jgi:hypothetical protein
VRQVTKAGCAKMFREMASGTKTDCSQIRRALDQLAAGDVLIVTRTDASAPVTLGPAPAVPAEKADDCKNQFDRAGHQKCTCHRDAQLLRWGGGLEGRDDVLQVMAGKKHLKNCHPG